GAWVAGVGRAAGANRPRWNGLRCCLAGGKAVGQDTGLGEIRAMAEQDEYPQAPSQGTVERRRMLEAYVEHVLSFIDPSSIEPLTVVAATANGTRGLVVPPVIARLPATLAPLSPQLARPFPHPPA